MVHKHVWDEAWPEYAQLRSTLVKEAKKRVDPNGTLAATDRAEFKRRMREEKVSLLLCFNCLEIRLGRRLMVDDFTPAPINRPIQLGYAMAKSLSRQCRFFFVPGVLSKSQEREQCQFPDGHEGPHSFESRTIET
jgi:hypothetical protein